MHECSEPKRVAFTEPRASAEPGTKRGRFGWRVRRVRKDDDEKINKTISRPSHRKAREHFERRQELWT
jgi:hypothetical protein